jgi:hypothetical protein
MYLYPFLDFPLRHLGESGFRSRGCERIAQKLAQKPARACPTRLTLSDSTGTGTIRFRVCVGVVNAMNLSLSSTNPCAIWERAESGGGGG